MHAAVAEPEGGARGARPLKFNRLRFFKIKSFIRMLKFKAQIERESIKTILQIPVPLSGPWAPAESEFGFALVMCVRAHNLLRTHAPPENPGSAPTMHVRAEAYWRGMHPFHGSQKHTLLLTIFINVLSCWKCPNYTKITILFHSGKKSIPSNVSVAFNWAFIIMWISQKSI